MWSQAGFKVRDDGIPFYELVAPQVGGPTGLSIWEIYYDKGYYTSPDGSRRSIAFTHRHNHFEIFWIQRGSGVLHLDGERIPIAAPSLMIVSPGEVHSWEETRGLGGSVLSISRSFTADSNFYLPFDKLSSLLEPNGARVIALTEVDGTLIETFFSLMRGDKGETHFERREVAKGLLLLLISKTEECGAPREERRATLSPITLEFNSLLQSECPPLSRVKEFAVRMNISRSFLHRSVLRDTGKSPSELIRDRLLLEAKRLLRHTSDSSAVIGRRLGFCNGAYFSTFFEQHTHGTPQDYRMGFGEAT